MKEFKRGVRRSSQLRCAARLRLAASLLLFFSFNFNTLFSSAFNTARAQTAATPGGGGQDQRGIGLKPDQQKQATPEEAKARGARPELVLQTGYAVMAATGMSFSPDGRLLATYTGMYSGQVKLWDTATGRELRTLAADTGGADFVNGGVRSIAFSRDGRLFAAGSDDGSTKVWEVSTGRELYKLGGDERGTGQNGVYRIAFSPDDQRLVALGTSSAKFWDLTTGQLASELEGIAPGGGAIYGWGGPAVTPDGSQILLISQDNRAAPSIKFVEIATGREARSVEVPHWDSKTNAIGSLAVTTDGRLLSADWELTRDMSGARTVKLDDLTAQKQYKLFDLPAGKYASMSFSPDGRQLATTVGNTVKLWDTATGAEVRAFDVPSLPSRLIADSYVWSVAFSPDSRLLATTGSDTQLTLWDATTGRAVRSLAGHVNFTYEAAFSADGTRLLTGGKTVWDISTGRGLRASAVDSPAALAQFSRDGRLLAERALTGSNSVALYDAQTHKLLHTLAPAERADLNQLAFSPDGRFVATSYRLDPSQIQERVKAMQGGAAKFDSKELMKMAQEAAKNAKNNPNAYTQAYAQLMAARMGGGQTGIDSQVKIWDTSTGKEVRSLVIPPANPFGIGMIGSIAFSGDGHTLAVSTMNSGLVRLFDVTTGQQVGELGVAPASGPQGAFGGMSMGGGDERVTSLAFSPDGRLVAVGGKMKENSFDYSALIAATRAQGRKMPKFDPQQVAKQMMEGMHSVSTVKIFNAQGGQEVLSLKMGANDAKAIAFSADSRTLAAASADSSIKLWDAASGTELRTLAGQGENITSLAFSPDGHLLASTSFEGSTILWDAKTGERLVTLISTGDGGDWLVVTPDGLFDGSPSAWNQI
nr:WD40 repeat domain-containing protein [Acidobacteriota bacterium]